jgi:hypothetical protein
MWNNRVFLGMLLWVIFCTRIVAMHLLDGPETDYFGSDEAGGFYEATAARGGGMDCSVLELQSFIVCI